MPQHEHIEHRHRPVGFGDRPRPRVNEREWIAEFRIAEIQRFRESPDGRPRPLWWAARFAESLVSELDWRQRVH